MDQRHGKRIFVCLAVLLCAGAAAAEPPPKAVAGAAPTDKEARAKRAMTLHDEARALYEQGRYRAAIERLQAALAIDPTGAELVYNLGLIHEKLAEVDVAEGYYRRYLEMDIDARARARIQGILRRLEGAKRELAGPVVAGPRAAASPAAPGDPAAPARPHPAPATHRPLRPSVVATGSVGVAALLVGSIAGLIAVAKNPGGGARTGGGVQINDLQDAARSAHTDARVADVAILLGLLTTGTAAVLYFTTDSTPVPAPRVDARAWSPVAQRGLLQVRF